jgi:hypothetical protein
MIMSNQEQLGSERVAAQEVGTQTRYRQIRAAPQFLADGSAIRSATCKPQRPTTFSQEEVAQLIDAGLTPYHRTQLITLDATGAGRAELTHLKDSHIDKV